MLLILVIISVVVVTCQTAMQDPGSFQRFKSVVFLLYATYRFIFLPFDLSVYYEFTVHFLYESWRENKFGLFYVIVNQSFLAGGTYPCMDVGSSIKIPKLFNKICIWFIDALLRIFNLANIKDNVEVLKIIWLDFLVDWLDFLVVGHLFRQIH